MVSSFLGWKKKTGARIDTSSSVRSGFRELILQDRVEVVERELKERYGRLRVLEEEKRVLEMRLDELSKVVKRSEDSLGIKGNKGKRGPVGDRWDENGGRGTVPTHFRLRELTLEERVEVVERKVRERDQKLRVLGSEKETLVVGLAETKLEDELHLQPDFAVEDDSDVATTPDTRIEQLEKGMAQYDNMVAAWDDYLVKLRAQIELLEAKLDEERVVKVRDEHRKELEMELMAMQQMMEVLDKSNADELPRLHTRIDSVNRLSV
ncbi:hypothetical protein K435DRAFT_874674 [Dendrothele bispora CBS 962.96]|uniref:Uncharacterized protein n=1 Tax=Dendrothele bispora (strain CBS 962.96) TaxID=1314807 RepID=A0A4S8KWG9_DENBC|nr:hypothetical protein K435DRAFT_874674 [Dendrothele bispora CBS 962.96]